MTNALNQVTRMAYDAKGNLTNLLDALSRSNRWTYDANGRNDATIYADGLTISKGYDAVGRLHAVTNQGSGLYLQYGYDDLNRMTNVVQLTNNAATASAWYAYDAAGRLAQKGYGNGDVATHAYDTESRLLSLGITNGSTLVTCYSYGWDTGGNILAITNNGTNITRYAYDAAGQLTNEISGSVTNSWQYDEAGNWLNATATTAWRYNADNELMGRVNTSDTNSVTVTGTVDAGPNNNKWYRSTAECRGVSAIVSPVNGSFSLSGVPLYPGTNQLFVTVTDVSGNTSQQERTVSKTAQESFQYDANGNLTNWVNGSQNWSYQWDWADRLTQATSNGVVVLVNYYNALAQRTAKKEVVAGQTNYTLYVSDGFDIVAVANQSAQILETYTRGVGLAGDIGTLVAVTHHTGSSTNGTFYTQNNHRGDVVLTRSGTTTVGTCGYSAFGILDSVSGSDVCRFKFSSKERDASTGFSYYGFRFYAPAWQRWPNRDPLAGWPDIQLRTARGQIYKLNPWENYGGPNLYTYVFNNPINAVDVNGLWTFQVGFGFSFNYGWGNISGSAGISGDTQGNISGYTTVGVGPTTAVGVSLGGGVTVQVSNAKCNNDLKGPFAYGSVGGGAGPYGSADGFWGNSADGPVIGGGFTIGPGLGAGAAAGLSGTGVKPIW